MRTLGAVLAGGQSRRFGSDKADAVVNGRSLLGHALGAIEPYCTASVVVGRTSPLASSIADWPTSHRGPLGGLAGALRFARSEGYDRVLSVPVDSAFLPADIFMLLDPAPACFFAQPVIGLWLASGLPLLEQILLADNDRSMRAFAAAAGARLVEVNYDIPNINRPEDLARLTMPISSTA